MAKLTRSPSSLSRGKRRRGSCYKHPQWAFFRSFFGGICRVYPNATARIPRRGTQFEVQLRFWKSYGGIYNRNNGWSALIVSDCVLVGKGKIRLNSRSSLLCSLRSQSGKASVSFNQVSRSTKCLVQPSVSPTFRRDLILRAHPTKNHVLSQFN